MAISSRSQRKCKQCERPLHRSNQLGQCDICRKASANGKLDSDGLLLKYVRQETSGATPAGLAKRLNCTAGQVLDRLLELKQQGRNLYQFGDRWSLEGAPATGGISDKVLISDKDGWFKFGAIGDTHMCSKQERVKELTDMYRIFDANGVKTVLHTGNYIDGEARFNKHEIKVHGMDAQLQYMGDRYPQVKGIQTWMVSGDDHEGWYAQREGVDIGYYMQQVMTRGGRTDIVNLGYMESFIALKHAVTGKTSMAHVIHPGGGSAYAISYTSQKQAEAYEGGEKPGIALIGHYHKAEHLESRNIHLFQTGCFQDQTVFMRKKKLVATIGGWIIYCRQNPKTGAIEEVVSYFKSYYNQKYYTNQRWSLSGPVAQVPRLAL